MEYFVYIIMDQAGRLYVGMPADPHKRLLEHNQRKGVVFTKSGLFSIVFLEKHTDRILARKRELQIKKWRREKKLALIRKYSEGIQTII